MIDAQGQNSADKRWTLREKVYLVSSIVLALSTTLMIVSYRLRENGHDKELKTAHLEGYAQGFNIRPIADAIQLQLTTLGLQEMEDFQYSSSEDGLVLVIRFNALIENPGAHKFLDQLCSESKACRNGYELDDQKVMAIHYGLISENEQLLKQMYRSLKLTAPFDQTPNYNDTEKGII